MHKLFFWLNWHAGDLVLTRPLVRQVLDTHDVQIVYGCWKNQAYIVEDLPVKIIVDPRDDPKDASDNRDKLLHLCPKGYLPISLWVGMDTANLSHNWQSMVELYNRQVESQGYKSLRIQSRYVPMVDFSPVEVEVAPRSVFVENGATRSKHSAYQFDIDKLAKQFPHLNFYCTAAPQTDQKNVFDGSRFNLRILSSISNRCFAILGKGSGPFCSTLTEVNRYKPRAILNYHPLNVVHEIWDYPGNPMQYLETEQDVERFLVYAEQREVLRLTECGRNAFTAVGSLHSLKENEAARMQLVVDQFLRNPADPEFQAEVIQIRNQLVEIWLKMPAEHFEYAYRGAWGKLTSKLLRLRIWELTGGQNQQREAYTPLNSEAYTCQNLSEFIACMLTCFPHNFPHKIRFHAIPNWLRKDLYQYLRLDFQDFYRPEAAERQFELRESVVRSLADCLTEEKGNPYSKQLSIDAMNLDLWPRNPVADRNPRSMQQAFGQIVEIALRDSDIIVDHTFSPIDRNRRARVGVIVYDLGMQADSFFNLPLIEFLNDEFDLRVYVVSLPKSPLTDYCIERGIRIGCLSSSIPAQAEVLREEDLDILVFACDFATDQRFTPLATLRVARYQLLANGAFTSGARAMDGVVRGAADGSQAEAFTETIEIMEGVATCFSLGNQVSPPIVEVDRSLLAIPNDATVFGTTVSAYDCTIELIRTWCAILKAVPNSVLFMLPFSPRPGLPYKKQEFASFAGSVLRSYGLAPSRLVMLASDPYPTYDQLPNYLCQIDVFLDACSASSRNDTIQALRLSMPVVTRRGRHPHTRVAANILEQFSPELVPYLVASTETEHLKIAAQLGSSFELRAAISERIGQTLPTSSIFDSRSFAQRFSKMLRQILSKIQ